MAKLSCICKITSDGNMSDAANMFLATNGLYPILTVALAIRNIASGFSQEKHIDTAHDGLTYRLLTVNNTLGLYVVT